MGQQVKALSLKSEGLGYYSPRSKRSVGLVDDRW